MVRAMGNFDIEQRTKDGMFNATSLLKQWNESGERRKDLDDFLSNANTREFISALKEDIIVNQSVPNPQKNGELKLTDNKEVTDCVIKASKGRYGCTWLHPLLFMKFAMWLNPRFEVAVLKFVKDELMELRNIAGDNYKLLSSSASIFPDVNYPKIAIALNWIVFNNHYEGIRQNATIEQLRELKDIQSNLAFSIDMGYINTFQKLIQTMRNMYSRKYRKF